MDVERLERYRDKINLIEKRIEQISEWINLDVDDFVSDEKTKLAVYKAFQEIVEACMDIISMICKDIGIIPKDDYTNIEQLKGRLDLDEDILKEANGLRNVLVHRYNSADDILAYESIKRIVPEISRFLETVEEWLKKIE